MGISDGTGPTLLLSYSYDNLTRGFPNWSATSDGVTTWVPSRAPDLWGHPPLGMPLLFTCHACSSSLECDLHRSYLSSGSILVLRLNASSTLHAWTLVTWTSPSLITGVWSGIHLSWPNSTVRVPMYDLSILSSGTSVHPGDRCLTTLWFLGARDSRDIGSRRSWDPTYVTPIVPMINDAQ